MSEATGSTILTEGAEIGTPADASDTAAPVGTEDTNAAEAAPDAGAQENATQESTATKNTVDADDGPNGYVLEGDLAESESLKRYLNDDGTLDIERLANGYLNAEKLIGGDKLPMPKGDDDTEGYERIYKALGRPDEADGYELGIPKDVPDELAFDEEEAKGWRDQMFQLGLSKKQAEALWDVGVKGRLESAIAGQELASTARAERENQIRLEKGDGYDGYVTRMKGVLKEYADTDTIAFLEESGQGNDPRFLRFLERVGDRMAPDTGLQGSTPESITTKDIGEQIDRFNKEHNEALTNKLHPRHNWAVRERSRLYEMKFPEQG